MDRYDTNSKGTSPALSALLNKFADMPRSPFDETRTKTLDAAPFAIIPIECFLMFPNSSGKYCIFLRVKINKRSPDFFNRYQLFRSLNDKNEHKVKD